jgi:hypothetical protein
MNNAARLLVAAALMLCAAPAFAQNAPAEPPPQADRGTTVQASCIDENDGYEMRGKQPMFVIELKNKCEKRMSCKVFAFITSAKGMAQGHGTIEMAPKSGGAAATGRFTMKAKMSGGNSQSTRECKAL